MKKKTKKEIKKMVRAMLAEHLKERTLCNLVNDYGEVYLRLVDGTGERFLQQAEQEGFTIGGKLPTTRPCDPVMKLHQDGTITYLGSIGLMGFGAHHCYGTRRMKVDFARYIAGEEKYLMIKKEDSNEFHYYRPKHA